MAKAAALHIVDKMIGQALGATIWVKTSDIPEVGSEVIIEGLSGAITLLIDALAGMAAGANLDTTLHLQLAPV